MAATIETAVQAPSVVVPEQFNLADYLVDRHVREGRGDRVAILCGDESITYGQVAERSNRVANGLRSMGLRREERVMLLLLDGPAFVYSFLGVLKLGAVAIPTNTLLKPHDYRYLLNDSRARALIVGESLLPAVNAIPREKLPDLEHVIIAGKPSQDARSLDDLLTHPAELAIADTSRDDAAFWLYSSGTTGFPKGAVHLHHDVVHTVELYGRGPGTAVYEGMIVGLNRRSGDIDVNATKQKQKTNMRASTEDATVKLVPPRQMSLEECLDFIEDDELVEVTPKGIRMRKRELIASNRIKLRKREA